MVAIRGVQNTFEEDSCFCTQRFSTDLCAVLAGEMVLWWSFLVQSCLDFFVDSAFIHLEVFHLFSLKADGFEAKQFWFSLRNLGTFLLLRGHRGAKLETSILGCICAPDECVQMTEKLETNDKLKTLLRHCCVEGFAFSAFTHSLFTDYSIPATGHSISILNLLPLVAEWIS